MYMLSSTQGLEFVGTTTQRGREFLALCFLHSHKLQQVSTSHKDRNKDKEDMLEGKDTRRNEIDRMRRKDV